MNFTLTHLDKPLKTIVTTFYTNNFQYEIR
jgi:hypothetical protein